MRLVLGRISVPISDELIDFDDFAETVIRVAPHAIHVRDGEIAIRTNWSSGDLSRVGRALRSYEVVNQLVINANVRGRQLENVGTRLAEIYLSDQSRLDEAVGYIASVLHDISNWSVEERAENHGVFSDYVKKVLAALDNQSTDD